MKYNTVYIETNKKLNWILSFDLSDNEERETGEKFRVSSLGFCHYRKTAAHLKAFNKLKSNIIKSHQKEIARLNKSLDKLNKLQYKAPKRNII